MEPGPTAGYCLAPTRLTRLERTFDWMLWITVEERKLIRLRAARVP